MVTRLMALRWVLTENTCFEVNRRVRGIYSLECLVPRTWKLVFARVLGPGPSPRHRRALAWLGQITDFRFHCTRKTIKWEVPGTYGFFFFGNMDFHMLTPSSSLIPDSQLIVLSHLRILDSSRFSGARASARASCSERGVRLLW